MSRIEITIEQLNELPVGTFFKIPAWDYEDAHTWTFRYVKSRKGYIYLGGGIDFGTAVGKINTPEKILKYVNECDYPYITVCELREKK